MTDLCKKLAQILVIDDDAVLRSLYTEWLGREGHRVFTAEDGEAGLSYYKRHTDEIDLVILDVVMPRRSGIEVFHSIKAINPEAKIILSSGYSPQIDALSRVVGQGVPFLPKPCPLGKLSETVDSVLLE